MVRPCYNFLFSLVLVCDCRPQTSYETNLSPMSFLVTTAEANWASSASRSTTSVGCWTTDVRRRAEDLGGEDRRRAHSRRTGSRPGTYGECDTTPCARAGLGWAPFHLLLAALLLAPTCSHQQSLNGAYTSIVSHASAVSRPTTPPAPKASALARVPVLQRPPAPHFAPSALWAFKPAPKVTARASLLVRAPFHALCPCIGTEPDRRLRAENKRSFLSRLSFLYYLHP